MNLAVEPYNSNGRNSSIVGTPLFDLMDANEVFADATPEHILRHALSHSERPLISSSFSAYSAALLHRVQKIRPDITVLWCDTGFNTPATYRFVDQLVARLHLNLKVYHPRFSATHLQARYREIPAPGTARYEEFTRTVKLEPFARAFADLQPDLWVTGIRREETEFRKTQNIFTWDAGRSVTKVAPTFYSSAQDLADYLVQHDLPAELDYFDPTKPDEHLECGLHY